MNKLNLERVAKKNPRPLAMGGGVQRAFKELSKGFRCEFSHAFPLMPNWELLWKV